MNVVLLEGGRCRGRRRPQHSDRTSGILTVDVVMTQHAGGKFGRTRMRYLVSLQIGVSVVTLSTRLEVEIKRDEFLVVSGL